jgi:hypothetical protein
MKEIKKQVQLLLKLLDNIKETHTYFVNFEINKMINEVANCKNYNKTEDVDYISDSFKVLIASKGNQNLHKFQKDLVYQFKNILEIAINLNQLLDKPLKRIQSFDEVKQKKLLSVKEFEDLYGISKTQQQSFRGRLKNALPYYKQSTKSKSSNTKIYYKIEEIEAWIENYL